MWQVFGLTALEMGRERRRKEQALAIERRLLGQLGTYSDPARDPRKHTISTVFIARASGTPNAGDDAGNIGIFARREIDFPLAFDHARILKDYFARKRSVGAGRR